MSKGKQVAARALHNPRWLVEAVRGRARRRGGWDFSLAPYGVYVADARTAVTTLLAVDADVYDEAVQADWWPEWPEDALAGRDDLAPIMRAIVRIAQPTVVVETGVARGVTSAATLQAMTDNDWGRLYSIDLPGLSADDNYTGSLVPDRLRHRWELILGPSRKELPRLLANLGHLDVFLHDAEHTYKSQIEEYETAWPMLRPGGMLVSDDVRNPAFIDFARGVGSRPYLVPRAGDRDAVGLLRKDW